MFDIIQELMKGDSIIEMVCFRFENMSDDEALKILKDLGPEKLNELKVRSDYVEYHVVTLLESAADWKDLRVMRLLLEAGANPKIPGLIRTFLDKKDYVFDSVDHVRKGLDLLESYGAEW